VKHRILTAWLVLTGKIVVDGSVVRCQRRHVGGDEEAVPRRELHELRRAAAELHIARGYIAACEKTPFARVVEETIE